jgi:hypothetical protein
MSVIGEIGAPAAGSRSFQTGSAAYGTPDHASGLTNRLHYRSSIAAKPRIASFQVPVSSDRLPGARRGQVPRVSSNRKCSSGLVVGRRGRWKEGSGAGLDTVTEAGTAAVAAAGTRTGAEAVSGPRTDAVTDAGTEAGAAAGPAAVEIRGPRAVQGAGAVPEPGAVGVRVPEAGARAEHGVGAVAVGVAGTAAVSGAVATAGPRAV